MKGIPKKGWWWREMCVTWLFENKDCMHCWRATPPFGRDNQWTTHKSFMSVRACVVPCHCVYLRNEKSTFYRRCHESTSENPTPRLQRLSSSLHALQPTCPTRIHTCDILCTSLDSYRTPLSELLVHSTCHNPILTDWSSNLLTFVRHLVSSLYLSIFQTLPAKTVVKVFI